MIHLKLVKNGEANAEGEIDPGECVSVPRSDLYTMLDKLTEMQSGLISLWDPDATIHPLSSSSRLHARDALNTAIVDLRKWIELVKIH